MTIYQIEILTAVGWWKVAHTDKLEDALRWVEKYRQEGHEARYYGKYYA